MIEVASRYLRVVKPNPVPLDGALRSERQIVEHRRLNCPLYGGCLDRSIAEGWESFSCTQCELARHLEAEPAESASQYAHRRTGSRFIG